MHLFNQTYQDNYEAIYRFATKMVGDENDASDIVQDSFIQLYSKLEQGKSIDNRRSWLFRVVNNRCIDIFRRKKTVALDSDTPITDDTHSTDERHALVRQAVATLKKQDRSLVTLYSENLSYKEIADITGIRLSSVGKLLSRALSKLETELKKKKYDLY